MHSKLFEIVSWFTKSKFYSDQPISKVGYRGFLGHVLSSNTGVFCVGAGDQEGGPA